MRVKRTRTAVLLLSAALVLGSATSAFAAGGSGSGGGAGGGSTATAGGGGGGGGAAGGGGGGVKVGCTNSLTVTGTATESLAGNSFSATYNLASCQSKTKVALTATDLSTGATVFSIPDTVTTTVFWNLPYTLTSYRIDARAYAPVGGISTTVATGSTTVATLDPLACTPEVIETPTVGYWITYAAIWAHHSANDCGLGGTVEVKITNLNTGVVELDIQTYAGPAVTYDYEGPAVSYGTPYRVQADLHSRTGELLASSSVDVTSAPKV